MVRGQVAGRRTWTAGPTSGTVRGMSGGRVYAQIPGKARSVPGASPRAGGQFAPERGWATLERGGSGAHQGTTSANKQTAPAALWDQPRFDFSKISIARPQAVNPDDAAESLAPFGAAPSESPAILAPQATPALLLQAKLTVGPADDPFEREADRVADQVMRMPASPPPSALTPSGDRTRLPMGAASQGPKGAASQGEDALGRKAQGTVLGGTAVPSVVHDVLRSPGQPLDAATLAFMEPRFGTSFRGVRVHTDAVADTSAREVHAAAYTVGSHIAFRRGAYAPTTGNGQGLLAHELAHVIQQGHAGPSVVQRDAAPAPSDAGGADANVSLGALDSAAVGAIAEGALGSAQWAVLREFLRGVKGGLQSASPAQVARIDAEFAHVGLRDMWDYARGYGLGILEGLWSSIEGLVETVITLVRLPYDIQVFLQERAPELAARYGPRLAALLADSGRIRARVQSVIDGLLRDPAGSLRDLSALIDAAGNAALGQVRGLGHAAAGRLLGLMEEPWFEYGVDVGRVVGQILFEVLLAVFSEGIANVVREAVSLGGRLLARVGAEAVDAFRALGRLIGQALEWLRGLGRRLAGSARRLLEPIEGILSELDRVIAELFPELSREPAFAGVPGGGRGVRVPDTNVMESRAARPPSGGTRAAPRGGTSGGTQTPIPHGPTTFPRRSLRGVSTNWLERNKPRGWRRLPADSHGGWKWLDENGVERLRFMRPSGVNPSASRWARQANGYFRWQNAAGAFLDIDGNVVLPSNPDFAELTHIAYEGL